MIRATHLLLSCVVLLGSACARQTSSYEIPGSIYLRPHYDVHTGSGELDVRESGDKHIVIKGTIKELKPGNYVVHIHQRNGCNPVPAEGHDDAYHYADLGGINADSTGVANVDLTAVGRLGGMDPVTGFCFVVYTPDISTYVASGVILTSGLVPSH